MLREALLHELIKDQEAVDGATRAVDPSAVPDPSHLVTELSRLVLAQFAQLGGRLDRIETGVSEIAKVTGIVQDQLRRWTVSYETISGTPRFFTLTPVSKHGLDKAAVWRDTYQLTLWCEHGDRPHPWRPAHYEFSKPRDWLITVAPYALGVLQILRVVVNVAAPIGTLADVDLASIKDDLDAMDKLLDQLPTQLPDAPAAPGQAAQPIQADGPELRALRALLTELDPNRTFNGMHVVATPSGDIRWVCQDHYAAYNPGPAPNG
jgi:internalin A